MQYIPWLTITHLEVSSSKLSLTCPCVGLGGVEEDGGFGILSNRPLESPSTGASN